MATKRKPKPSAAAERENPDGIAIDQRYEVVSVDEIQPHPKNPRRGVVEAIDESIETNGWFGACIVQESTGFILAGNHRYKAAVARGAAVVPVIYRDVDDETALRILLADNKTADLGTYDEETLTEVLAGLSSLDGTGYGFEAAMGRLQDLEGDEGDEGGLGDDDGDIPDDTYTPQYGIMVVCESEEDQAATYEKLKKTLGDRQLRVVAV